MADDGNLPQKYLLRVAAEEMDFMEKEYLLLKYPHVAAFVQHPFGRTLLQHVQNFCWTVERLLRRHRRVLFSGQPGQGAPRQTTTCVAPVSGGPRPKVWIDITNTHRSDFSGGIERAASKLAKAALETGLACPVFMQDGEIFEYTGHAGQGAKLRFAPDTVYVIADSFWQQIDEYREICQVASAEGAKVVLCIHDVIPLYYPSFNRTAFVRDFARAFAGVIELCDGCIASSNYSREKVRVAIKEMRLRIGRPLPLTYFHLGCDGHVCADADSVRDGVRELFEQPRVFLGVGTLEPRKGYAVTLDAFDELWRRGHDCAFVLIGRPGWISKSLEQRITGHALYGKSLHWLDDASDAELTFAYRNAYCLVQASITEGFGLPIVEASLEGTPVIATDNEIFRELAGDEIIYFRNCDSADLAEVLEAAMIERPIAGRLAPLKWDQSLAQMVSRISELLEVRQAA